MAHKLINKMAERLPTFWKKISWFYSVEWFLNFCQINNVVYLILISHEMKYAHSYLRIDIARNFLTNFVLLYVASRFIIAEGDFEYQADFSVTSVFTYMRTLPIKQRTYSCQCRWDYRQLFLFFTSIRNHPHCAFLCKMFRTVER